MNAMFQKPFESEGVLHVRAADPTVDTATLQAAESPQHAQSQIEYLHSRFESVGDEYERLDEIEGDLRMAGLAANDLSDRIKSRMDEISDEEDVIQDLLSFERPKTLHEIFILLNSIVDIHFDALTRNAAENKDEKVRYEREKKIRRMIKAIQDCLATFAETSLDQNKLPMNPKTIALISEATELVNGNQTEAAQ